MSDVGDSLDSCRNIGPRASLATSTKRTELIKMRPRSFAPLVAAMLMAATILTAFPLASTRASSAQQSAGSRQRRGKNGSRVAPPTTEKRGDQGSRQTVQNNGAETDLEPDPQEDSQSSGAGDWQDAPAPQKDDSGRGQPQNPQARQSSEADRGHKEPAPFDRPPLGTTTGNQPAAQPATRYPSQQTQQPSRQEQAGRQIPRQPQPVPQTSRQPDTDTSSRQPPNLGGYDDSRGKQRPPVLQRPSRGQSQQEPDDQDPGDQQDNSAQTSQSRQGQVNGDEPIKLAATLVNIPVLVSDRSGRYVPQLSQRDFELYEDGKQQEIAFFGDEEVPFKVALLLDVSPSVQGSLEDIQDAAIEFVRQLRPQDQVMVISFDRYIHFHTGFTNDRRQLEWAIRQTTTASGTSVYDAVYETVRRRLNNVEGRKAMILFSDGEDTTSEQASYDDAIDIVTESDVLVYGLRYPGTGMNRNRWPTTRDPFPRMPIPLPFPWPWPGGRRRGPFTGSNLTAVTGATSAVSVQRWPRRGRNGDFMQDITTAGGGPVYDAQQISDLRRLASRIAEELRHVYVVSYYPTNPLSNGGYRQLRIRVRGRDDIAVRHRKGYNAHDLETRTGT